MKPATMLTHEMVYAALEDVHDPEIPVLSIVDMGIVTDVTISDSRVAVTITPTFVGCPALDAIRTAIAHRLSALSIANVEVIVDYATPWSSNRLSERGRQALAEIGFAPPPRFEGEFEPDILLNAQCPYCGSSHTVLRSPFGPALCRAIYYCNDCHQAFEQFKAIG